jgi:hypothetical protein
MRSFKDMATESAKDCILPCKQVALFDPEAEQWHFVPLPEGHSEFYDALRCAERPVTLSASVVWAIDLPQPTAASRHGPIALFSAQTLLRPGDRM